VPTSPSPLLGPAGGHPRHGLKAMSGLAACRVGGLLLPSILLDTPCRAPPGSIVFLSVTLSAAHVFDQGGKCLSMLKFINVYFFLSVNSYKEE
jgi:hypothetical protein